jgi:hypothetical protein
MRRALETLAAVLMIFVGFISALALAVKGRQ